ncbi:putative metacaspase [Chiua virens]|nr:putative metacaspase [Chiua virens]
MVSDNWPTASPYPPRRRTPLSYLYLIISTSLVMAYVGGQKKALLIAIKENNVPGFAKLCHAHRDVKELKQLLIEDPFGYPECDITLMIDHKSVSSELWPTKTNIRKQIFRFVKGVSAGDHLFFYYSGHGHQVTCNHHTEPDGLDEVIYTCNKKQIMDNDLKKWLVNPLPPGCKLFALWDSCHSQTILDLPHTSCNEPEHRRHVSWDREAGLTTMLLRAVPKRFWKNVGVSQVRRNAAATIPPEVLRGRPVSRASVSITALSSGSSPTSRFIPLSMDLNRVLSPLSLFECNGICSLPTENDTQSAHVISLSACKDDESAVDECCNGQVRSVTRFFIGHMRENPKSTLRELLMAVRQGVDEITAERLKRDAETKVISRQATFASETRIQTKWIPQPPRRTTIINMEEYFNFTPSRNIKGENENDYSQKPSYSSHYRLNLDEPVDL